MFDIQRTFAVGEIAPSLYGRADVARFSAALRSCRNFVVRKEGGVKNRQGTQFIAEVKDSSKATKLLKFVFNDNDSLVLEFGNLYVRFFNNGAAVAIATPAAWDIATPYAARDLVSYGGVNYYCRTASTGNQPDTSPTQWYPLTGNIYEIPTPFTTAMLPNIRYEQSGDVLTLVHPDLQVNELIRYGDTAWSVANPTITNSPFTGANDYPGTVTFYQQRRIFASTNDEPEDIFVGKTGDYYDFTTGVNPADGFQFALAGRGINQVRHLVGVAGRFVALTSGGSWVIGGGSDRALMPTAINAQQNEYIGAGNVRPVVVGPVLLYEQSRGSLVRAVNYDFGSDSLKGEDLTIYSSHLFTGRTIAAMDYQAAADTVLWCVMSDGAMIGMTYLPEQEVAGWHRHDTDGSFEDVCIVPEGTYDAVYTIVNRTIGGATKRYVERVADQFVDDMDEARFLDSWLSYDGTNATATTLTLSGSGWTSNDTLTLTASASIFIAGDVGNAYDLNAGGVTRRVVVTGYTSGTVVSVRPDQNIPVALQAVATAVWSKAVDELSGLSHLEGKTVSVLADYGVVSDAVVASGAITLAEPATKIVVGLPITSEIELLDIEQPNGMTLIDSKKRVHKVKVLVESSRGLKASCDGGTTFDDAVPAEFVGDDYGAVPELFTGVTEINLGAEWNDHGRVIIRQTDPLPVTVLAVAPVYAIGKDY